MPVFRSRLFLFTGISMVIFALCLAMLPSLDGVEKGVYIKIRTVSDKIVEKYLNPNSPEFVRSDRLPKHVTGAIITAEDEDFYRHNGVSWDEIKHALEYDIGHMSLKCGGSTITQQLVKNVYLNKKKTFHRKIIEAVTAIRLEKRLSKKQILDYYLNIIEFGRGIYGIKNAANVYFDKQPQDLTVEEAVTLAVLMPKPVARGQALKDGYISEYQKKRIAYILKRMKKLGYLRQENAQVKKLVDGV
jgi:monofunctional glycosyltransferase